MNHYQHFSDKEIEILRERAERVARDNTEREKQATIPALIVNIRSEVYALPVEHIVTVYEDVPMVPVPSVPAHIHGIANLRGHITPVVDLSVLLNIPANQVETVKHYLIVVSEQAQTAALLVEQVGEIVTFDSEEITTLASDDKQAPFIQGIASTGETLIKVSEILLQSNSHQS